MKTEPIITLSLAPPDSKRQVSGITFGTAQDTASLIDSNTAYTKRITGEPDLVKLDGSYQFYESPADCCYSAAMSGAQGNFAVPVSVRVSFNQTIRSSGITLYFGDTYASSFTVQWQMGNKIVATRNVENNSSPCIVPLPDEVEYDNVLLSFFKTDQPYRYLKLTEIDFGENHIFSGNNLKSAKMLDEFDYLANELDIGTLTLAIYDKTDKLDMMNPNSLYNRLLVDQEIRCTMKVTEDDGTEKEVPMGVYYLSDWKNVDRNNVNLTAGDILQKFDRTVWNHSPYYDPVIQTAEASILFDKVFEAAGFDKYEVDWNVGREPVSGYIKDGTIRSALQDLCVATRSALRVNADSSVEIYRPSLEEQDIQKELTAIIGEIQVEDPRKNKIEGISVEYYRFAREEEISFYDYQNISDTTSAQSLSQRFDRNTTCGEKEAKTFLCSRIEFQCHADESAPQVHISNMVSKMNRVDFTAKVLNPFWQPECGFVYYGNNIGSKSYTYSLQQESGQKISGNMLMTEPYEGHESGNYIAVASYWYEHLKKYNFNVSLKAILIPTYIRDYIGMQDAPQERFWSLRTGDYAVLPDYSVDAGRVRYIGLNITSVETDLTGGMLATIKGITSKEDIHVADTEN